VTFSIRDFLAVVLIFAVVAAFGAVFE